RFGINLCLTQIWWDEMRQGGTDGAPFCPGVRIDDSQSAADVRAGATFGYGATAWNHSAVHRGINVAEHPAGLVEYLVEVMTKFSESGRFPPRRPEGVAHFVRTDVAQQLGKVWRCRRRLPRLGCWRRPFLALGLSLGPDLLQRIPDTRSVLRNVGIPRQQHGIVRGSDADLLPLANSR